MHNVLTQRAKRITRHPRLVAWVFVFLATITAVPATAQEVPLNLEESFFRGEITGVVETTNEAGLLEQELTVALRGDRDGDVVTSQNVLSGEGDAWRRFEEGDRVVVLESETQDTTLYFVTDYYRLPSIVWFIALFFLLALVVARRKGFFALLGLVLSIVVIGGFMVPQIAAGQSPLVIGGLGAVGIAVASLYVAHGFNARTSLALVGMLITIALAALLSWFAVDLLQLFGVGSEEAYSLQIGLGTSIDLRGLLLAGVLIGSLGVLDDVTTSLVATVGEIHDANPMLGQQELLRRGWKVGTEHIASLINTLVLAYAGTSLPLLLLFTLDFQPFWVTLNGQFLAEEILRTVIGSSAILLAIPITTVLAARYYAASKTARS